MSAQYHSPATLGQAMMALEELREKDKMTALEEAKDVLDYENGMCCVCNRPLSQHDRGRVTDCLDAYEDVLLDGLEQARNKLPKVIKAGAKLRLS